jgi:hypothetical protein
VPLVGSMHEIHNVILKCDRKTYISILAASKYYVIISLDIFTIIKQDESEFVLQTSKLVKLMMDTIL